MGKSEKLGFRLLILLFFLLGNRAQAEALLNIPELGPHFRVLVVEKNENPQNIAIIYTKLDSTCHFAKDSKGKTVFDFYWLMDGTRYKPMNWILKAGIRHRFEMESATAASGKVDAFAVKLNDLKEMKTDLKEVRLIVEAKKKADGKCEVENLFPLGGLDHESFIHLDKVSAEGKKTWHYPFREVVALTLQGQDSKSGEKVDRKYLAK